MANEWVKVELFGQNNDGNPVRYTIADGTSVSKGQLLKLSDPRTAIAQTNGCRVAGVASEDHLANVGSTSIALWTDGIFEVVASLGMLAGDYFGSAGNNNTVGPVVSGAAIIAASLALVAGRVLEDCDAGETINVRLRL